MWTSMYLPPQIFLPFHLQIASMPHPNTPKWPSPSQGEAYQVYGLDEQVTVRDVLNTPVNHITFIANVHVKNSSHWFSPGENNTDGCGQLQTWELPFGFSGKNASESLPTFMANLRQLHASGITITLTMVFERPGGGRYNLFRPGLELFHLSFISLFIPFFILSPSLSLLKL